LKKQTAKKPPIKPSKPHNTSRQDNPAGSKKSKGWRRMKGFAYAMEHTAAYRGTIETTNREPEPRTTTTIGYNDGTGGRRQAAIAGE
jgi:hypothetical protein